MVDIMANIIISTKQLRTDMPRIRAGLARGNSYTVVYRSQPIGEITPAKSINVNKPTLPAGGRFNFTKKLGRELTPELFNEIALTKYDS